MAVRGRNRCGQVRAIKAKQTSRVPFTTSGISKIPKSPGVYKINQYGKTRYIGSTNDLHRRVKEHQRTGNTGTSVSYQKTSTRTQAYNLERNSIRRTCPSRNRTKPNSCKGFWERFLG